MMSGIKGKNTKPELIIRSMLHKKGFRFRIHNSKLPSKPDIVLKKYRAVILIHGCFWHRHQCRIFKWPQTNQEFWEIKINKNYENDIKKMNELHEMGWRICIIWECAIKGAGKDLERVISDVTSWIRSENNFMEIAG